MGRSLKHLCHIRQVQGNLKKERQRDWIKEVSSTYFNSVGNTPKYALKHLVK